MQDNQSDPRDLQIQELKRQVAQLQEQTGRSEREKQNMRNMRGKLDEQIDIFAQIHRFTQRAFHIHDQGELNETMAEGVVDIFQLEIGAVLELNAAGDALKMLAGCNAPWSDRSIALPESWRDQPQLWNFRRAKAWWESPVQSPCLQELGLAHTIVMPIFSNARRVEGFVLGAISQEGERFYDFLSNEIASGFTVYCQMMNGIIGNLEALNLAYEAGQAKTQFLANLSHEMRTPMNAIIGLAQIAKYRDDLASYRQAIDQINTSSQHMLNLLNDVLDISKIEEGKLELSIGDFALKELIEQLLTSIRPLAEEKQQRLELRINLPQAQHYIGDDMRLAQVLINFLTNAVKFTDKEGRIELKIEELSRDKDKSLLGFAVRDSGIGISEEFMGRIFTPFEQADGSISRRYGGTGLGLAISRRIVELMGGQIRIESQPGQGSCFSFAIWLERGQQDCENAPEAAPITRIDLQGRHLLIVDDIEINREIIQAFLDESGARISQAANGLEAVEMIAASPEGDVDLVLMDVQMPVMDGYTATRAIRALPRRDARSLLILALTANVFKEDVEKVLAAGMDGHIGKPVQYETMMASIAKAFQQRQQAEHEPQSE